MSPGGPEQLPQRACVSTQRRDGDRETEGAPRQPKRDRGTETEAAPDHPGQADPDPVAEARLTELESRNDDDLDAVLVNIARISQLQAAYPNYYADTSMFTDFVTSRIDGSSQ